VLASFANFLFLTVAAKPPTRSISSATARRSISPRCCKASSSSPAACSSASRARPHPPSAAGRIVVRRDRHDDRVDHRHDLVTAYLKRNATRSESSALAGDALHYTSDIVSNGATIIALIIVRITGNPLFDSILGVSVACWIGWNAVYLIWNAGGDLMDPALPEEEIGRIVAAIERAHPTVIGYRELRTRRAAGMRFVDFELCIDRGVSFEQAHEVTELVKARIHEVFPRVVVTVHAEPVESTRPDRSA
jgi:Co/Zn/Cd efflux system component